MRIISLIDTPIWSLGVYGSLFDDRSATPFLDRLAGSGFTLDAVFAADVLTHESDAGRLVSGCEVEVAINDLQPGAIDAWLPTDCFPRLCEDLLNDGVSAAAVTNPQTLAEHIAVDGIDGYWDATLLLELDEAAQFARAMALARASEIDNRLAAELGDLDDVLAAKPTAILCLPYPGPPGVPTQPICDNRRHVGVVLAGSGIPMTRDRAMLSLDRLASLLCEDSVELPRLRQIATEAIRFETQTHRAVRTQEAFFIERREPDEIDGTLDARLFLKPDDRWNQFNVAGLEPEHVAAMRQQLTPAG